MIKAASRVGRWSAVAALILACSILGQPAVAQVAVVGDVDANGVVTCRDVALARKAVGMGTGQAGFLPKADLDGNGSIDGGDIERIVRLLPAGSVCEGVTNYLIVQGHDGSPDPDDNLAQLAGFIAIKRNSGRNPRVAFGGLVFGDTTSARKATMISGTDLTSRANWDFHRLFNVPALIELGLDPSTHADVVTEQWNFGATNPADITSGGRLLFEYVKAAIDANGMDRVVYTAGGGHHAPAEAIALLRNLGYSDAQILEHFAVVQHSRVNWTNFTEAGPARPLTLDFTIRIDDQNGTSARGPNFRPRSGSNFPPTTVSPTCTSPAFATAWHAAAVGGAAESGIPNHLARNDASDSGEAAFASTPLLMDRHWYTRGVGLSLTINPNLSSACNTLANQNECVVYADYSTPEMNANLNCIVTELKGSASRVGEATDGAQVQLDGHVALLPPDDGVNLGVAQITLLSLLKEAAGAGELVDAVAPGPVTFVARSGGKPTSAVYESQPSSDRPSFRLELRRRSSGLLEFRLRVDRAVLSRDPTLCSASRPSTTDLVMRFLIDDGEGIPVQVATTKAWECIGQTPEDPKELKLR